MKTVLITGGSSGVGLELAKIFSKNGYQLVLVSRQKGQLLFAAKSIGGNIKLIAKDLSHRNSAEEIHSELQRRGIEIDILVNNAGFGSYGKFIETDLNLELDMIEVNVSALTHLTKLLLPSMIKRKEGKILNVASTAAFLPGPTMTVYFATKAYVLSFSQALSSELEGTGISVTCVCPGPFKSGFQKRAGIEQTRLIKDRRLMTGEEIAKQAYEALMKGKRVHIPGFWNRVTVFMARNAPTGLVMKVFKKRNEVLKK